MGWQTKGTDSLISSSTLLQTPDWSCTMLCECILPSITDSTVNWTHSVKSTNITECYLPVLPFAGTWLDQIPSLWYLIRAATESAAPGSQRATGLIHRTAPICERQIYCQNTARERRKNKTLARERERERELTIKTWWDVKGCRQMEHGPRVSSMLRLTELRGARHAWTFSITMGMFYLCTFLFSKRRAADTEVHLMKNCMYLYLCMCMLCSASCMCSVYVFKCV